MRFSHGRKKSEHRWIRIRIAMVSALAASGLGVTISMLAVPASASSLSVRAPTSSNWPTNGGYYYLQNLDGDSSACLDANLNTLPANGTNVQTWRCNGWGNQTWIFYSHSNMDTSWFTIENYDGGQCLDADANTLPANGTRVQMWGCNGRGNQNWWLHAAGYTWNGYPIFTITSGLVGPCLDGNANTLPANGTRVQMWACNGWSNQRWILIPIS